MLKKLRKSSGSVTLVLIGVAALAGCSQDSRRDLYATREDCLADWANTPQDCTPATDSRHAGRGYFYGPSYFPGRTGASSSKTWNRPSGASSTRSSSSRSFSSSSSSSRGGFGSSGRSSSS